jgi:hypothetical protein
MTIGLGLGLAPPLGWKRINAERLCELHDVADKAVVDGYCRRHNMRLVREGESTFTPEQTKAIVDGYCALSGMRLITEQQWMELHTPAPPPVVEPPAPANPVFNALAVNERGGGLLNPMRYGPIAPADFDNT